MFDVVVCCFVGVVFVMVVCVVFVGMLMIVMLNNFDMIELKKLLQVFEKVNFDIKLNWVIFEENVLCQCVMIDIMIGSGQFDVMVIGIYEMLQWGKCGWFVLIMGLLVDYDLNDIVKIVCDSLLYNGQFYVLLFYVESLMMFYCKDLFVVKGLKMFDQLIYDQIVEFVDKFIDKLKGIYGICLCGKVGWGENMVYVLMVVNMFGGCWFDENWNVQFMLFEWKKVINFYVNLLKKNGLFGVSLNGFNENLMLIVFGKCVMWIDVMVVVGMFYNKQQLQVVDKIGFVVVLVVVMLKGLYWLWVWVFVVLKMLKQQDVVCKFIVWVMLKQYIEMVGKDEGWVLVLLGMCMLMYKCVEYKVVVLFFDFVLKVIEMVDLNDLLLKKVLYMGVQYVGIFEFQLFGMVVGQLIVGVVVGQMLVDQVFVVGQVVVDCVVWQVGYKK